MDEKGFIAAGEKTLHYRRWGNGDRLLLAFHGYGNDSSLFKTLAGHLEDRYTLISADLPYHGKSRWAAGQYFSKDDLRQFVRNLLAQTGFSRLSLAGYSMGGRISLNLIEMMPRQIEQALLIAPDGLENNLYYRFFTRSAPGRYIFRTFMENGDAYYGLLRFLKKCGIINQSRYKLVSRHMTNKEARELLLNAWPAMSPLLADPETVRARIRDAGIPVHVFMGRYDRIIPVAHAKRFSKGIPGISVHVMEKGHLLFDNSSLKLMAAALL